MLEDFLRCGSRMEDLSLPLLVVEFFRQDPFRALGLAGVTCVAISAMTDFDLLSLLGFVDVAAEDVDRETTAA
ncbi:hypothetical protein [Bradyrhizobium sp. LHD-71]|uniref:hypothetical protein n=1 Tax=Bradyrhizobium sp. LHD-71 TaxID=3072141 RepID=UPI00280D2D82|nr:hypothetical protein [Bradyrhizobium sp. LHD-71]MDQ8732869.1 hypothetical protein [Bradyrhizobium sp. LHD-71]